MSDPVLTADSFPNEYACPPIYDRVPSIWAIEKMQNGMKPADALANEIPAAIRFTMRT